MEVKLTPLRPIRVMELEEEVGRLRSAVELINQEYAEEVGRAGAAEEARVRAELRVKELEEEINKLIEVGKGTRGEAGRLEMMIDEMQARITFLEAELQKVTRERESLSSKLTLSNSAAHTTTHQTIDKLRRAWRTQEMEIQSLRETLQHRDQEILTLQKSNAEWLRRFRKQKHDNGMPAGPFSPQHLSPGY